MVRTLVQSILVVVGAQTVGVVFQTEVTELDVKLKIDVLILINILNLPIKSIKLWNHQSTGFMDNWTIIKSLNRKNQLRSPIIKFLT